MNYTTILVNTVIHIILVLIFEGVFLFSILYPILANKVEDIINDFTWNILYRQIWPTINFSKCSWPPNPNITIKPEDLTPYYITQEKYNLIQLVEKEEQKHIDSNKNYPYVVYTIIMTFLIILVLIIIFISIYMDLYINYKYIIINSIIIFIFICAIAATILWFDVFSQDYQIDITKPFLEKFLEKYKSL